MDTIPKENFISKSSRRYQWIIRESNDAHKNERGIDEDTTRVKRYNGRNMLKSKLIILMFKFAKSELKLRPTYDQMIGMIEDAAKEN